jgi:hypothetical protein
MKKSKVIFRIITAVFVIGIFATAATGFAFRGNRMGYGMNPSPDRTALTAEQQQKVDAVKEKYSPKLDEIQAALNAKIAEIRRARASDSTTIGSLKSLETEVAELERQYWTLLDKANNEAGQFVSGSYGPWFNCAYDGYSHRNHRHGSINDHYMGQHHRQSKSRCNW